MWGFFFLGEAGRMVLAFWGKKLFCLCAECSDGWCWFGFVLFGVGRGWV